MKKLYRIVICLVFLGSIPFLVRTIYSVIMTMRNVRQLTFFLIPAFLLILGTLLIKAVRFYFIILEKRMGLDDFVQTYLGTTLVSILFPFKFGEIFRAFVYGKKLRQFKIGILLVLIDRYFDTVPLVAMLLGIFVRGGNVSSIVWILTAFIVLASLMYIIFPSSFRYLNRFLISNENTEKSLIALEWLSKINNGYQGLKELIHGREIFLLFLSACAWISEYSALFCLARGLGQTFGPGSFVLYMSSIFTGNMGEFGSLYIGVNCIFLVFSGMLLFIAKKIRRKKVE